MKEIYTSLWTTFKKKSNPTKKLNNRVIKGYEGIEGVLHHLFYINNQKFKQSARKFLIR